MWKGKKKLNRESGETPQMIYLKEKSIGAIQSTMYYTEPILTVTSFRVTSPACSSMKWGAHVQTNLAYVHVCPGNLTPFQNKDRLNSPEIK